MSMRLPILPPSDLNDQQRDVYHHIVHGPRSTGPRLSSAARVEVSTLVGYYGTLALQTRVLRVV